MISISHISKAYGQTAALKQVSLEISTGTVFGLIGHSGAGKSTLLRCINLLERPDTGRVCIHGVNLTDLSPRELPAARRQTGMIFQHFNLMAAATVAANIALPLKLQGLAQAVVSKRVDDMMQRLNIGEHARKYPAQLSGGQKQRVGIARALVTQPAVLLCDEATSALDPMATQATLSLLKELNGELRLTVVVVTHEMGVVRDICDHVAVMENGEIVEMGYLEDIFGRPAQAVTRRLLGEGLCAIAPPTLIERYNQLPADERSRACVVQLLVHGAGSSEPFLWRLMKQHPVRFNILGGAVSSLRGTSFGQLMVELRAETAASLQQALAWLRQLDGIRVDVIL